MDLRHSYDVALEWRGNRGTGTSGYRDYGREHVISASGKPSIDGSADRAFHGDVERWNPEEMLVAALSQCHMLSYLHVAFSHGVIVTGYTDSATGVMEQAGDGGGHFLRVTLRPVVTVDAATTGPHSSGPGSADAASITELAESLHAEASRKCFIAASVNFPVDHEPTTIVAS